MNRVTITAIIPVYNVEKYIEDCLNSVFNQTEPFDEIIIINDGSTDTSDSIVEELIEGHSEVRYISQNNRGLSAVRNEGINRAESDYIIFIDSDDYVCFNMAEVLREKINNQEVLLYSADVANEICVENDCNCYVRDKIICGINMTGWDYFNRVYYSGWTVSACLAAYNLKFLKNNNIYFPEGLLFEDNYFFFCVLNCAISLEAIDDVLYIRRYRADSIVTTVKDIRKNADYIKVFTLVVDYLKDIYTNSIAKDIIERYVGSTCFEILSSNCDNGKFAKLLITLCETFYNFTIKNNNKNSLSKITILAYTEWYLFNKTGLYWEKVEKSRINLKNRINKLLSNIMFNNPNTKIGIYGVGNHTKALIEIYGKLVGEIKANIIYIVTDSVCNTNESVPIISVKNVNDDFDQIVLSSRIYQDAMNERLLQVGYCEDKIVKLYDDNEWLDVITAKYVLELLEK